METTRDSALRFLRGHKEATVAQIAGNLGVSQHAIRRHLDGLRADGYVDARFEHHGVGRPTLVFFATEQGEELAGKDYLHLLSRVLRHLECLSESDVAGSSGPDLLKHAFAGVAVDIAAIHRGEVQGASLEQRVGEASRALTAEGILDGWQKSGLEYRLSNGCCPYLRVAEISDAPCHSDRQAIELLLGVPVEQVRRIADGETVCEYIVRQEPVELVKGEVEIGR